MLVFLVGKLLVFIEKNFGAASGSREVGGAVCSPMFNTPLQALLRGLC